MWILEMMHAESMREAAALLARRGYDNVQASGLAQAMRMSVGTLYRRYGSKPGLALAVRDFTEKELSDQAEVAFMLSHGRPGVSFGQAFHAFWWELARWALALLSPGWAPQGKAEPLRWQPPNERPERVVQKGRKSSQKSKRMPCASGSASE